MGIINWFMQRNMLKEARRLAKEVARLYPESRSKNPNASESEVIKAMVFNEEALAQIPESSRMRIGICCETIQGFCYMMALDAGKLKGLMNFRSLQFTHYMDKALEAQGFPPQSKEQKERILDAMELRINGWEKYSGYIEPYSRNPSASELERFAKQREELGIEDDNYIIIAKNMSKYSPTSNTIPRQSIPY